MLFHGAAKLLSSLVDFWTRFHAALQSWKARNWHGYEDKSVAVFDPKYQPKGFREREREIQMKKTTKFLWLNRPAPGPHQGAWAQTEDFEKFDLSVVSIIVHAELGDRITLIPVWAVKGAKRVYKTQKDI